MIQIILAIIAICIIVAIIRKIAGFILALIKGILGLIYLIIAGPAILCTKIFYSLSKFLHIQSFAYYLLSLFNFSIPAFIYLFSVHIPYSKKEKIINSREFSENMKKTRYETISMACFLKMEGLLFLGFLPLIGAIYVISALIYSLVKITKWKRENETLYDRCIKWRKWIQKEAPEIYESEIEERLIGMSINLSKNDNNENKFIMGEMPYGRSMAFISYFNKSLEDEEPVYFSPKMSSDDNEIREYGTLITSKGIYISVEHGTDTEIPIEGLWNISKYENRVAFDYGLIRGIPHIISINKNSSSIDLDILTDNLKELNDISLAMAQEKVSTELDDAFGFYEDAEIYNEQENFDNIQNVNDMLKAAEMGGIGAGLAENAHIYNDEVKYLMNGARGGGYAAEYGNNAIDRLSGNKVRNMAQELENGHQKLHSADRNVNGVNIQTKYYKSASESIGSAFEHEQALYLNDNGKMMQIEVPRDQYYQAIQEMQKRIISGQVPGETNPENAKNYVRKGHFTYMQANNIALAGSIEGIAVDFSQGIVCSFPGAEITFVLSFASAVWHGCDIKEAAKQSTLAGLRVMGKSAIIYAITMQLSRDKIINIFAPKIMGEEFLDIVMLFSFNKEEFDEIVSATIGNPDMSKVLQAMYQSGFPKEYADDLINAEVQAVLAKRENITFDKIEHGMQLLLEDKSVA